MRPADTPKRSICGLMRAARVAALFIALPCALALADQCPSGQAQFRLTQPGKTCFRPYDDHTIVTIWEMQGNAPVGKGTVYPGDTPASSDTPLCLNLETEYMVQVEGTGFMQPLNCTIRTDDDASWQFSGNCPTPTTPGADPACKGCPYLTTNATHGEYIQASCVGSDPTSQNYLGAYLLDRQGDNLLFRGPSPAVLTGQETPYTERFDIFGLMDALRQRHTLQTGTDFPAQYRFLDISLISAAEPFSPTPSNVPEGFILNAEYRFMNPRETSITAMPKAHVYIYAVSDATLPVGLLGPPQLLWWQIIPEQDSQMGGLVQQIGKLMSSKGTPWVIYVHCISGADRTGAVAVSHLLGNTGMPPKDAFLYGTTVYDITLAKTRRVPVQDYMDNAQAYCNALCGKTCDFGTDTTSLPPAGAPYPWSRTSWGGACPQ